MVLRALLAIVLSLLFLVGRWNLQRLAVNPDAVDFDLIVERSVTTVLIEPRLWLVIERAARNDKFVEAFWLWLELLLIAIGAFALFTQLFLAPAASADLPGRLSILGGGPNILGRFLRMLCLLMVAQSLRHGGGLRWSVAWRIVAAAVALILLLQTGS